MLYQYLCGVSVFKNDFSSCFAYTSFYDQGCIILNVYVFIECTISLFDLYYSPVHRPTYMSD